MLWNWDYTIHIMEERPNGEIVWILEEKTHSLKDAYQIIFDAINKMKYPPYSVRIYKDWKGHTVPTVSFEWGEYPAFNTVNFYL